MVSAGREHGKETQEWPPEDGKWRENAKKMLNLYGTNSTSPLESTKVPKKQTQTNPKQTQNEAESVLQIVKKAKNKARK
jgi:hypothetical protein